MKTYELSDKTKLMHFFNDALCVASNMMCPIWNDSPLKSYTISNSAAQFIDACKISEIIVHKSDEEIIALLLERIKRIEKSHYYENSFDNCVKRFVENWKIILMA